uniref:G-protein coupled receptors family 1 profile domain-containing protein n=1 Tax=Neogobius melanostomus TaxID=47308 RepID=A0A8C6S7X7_9GOBI
NWPRKLNIMDEYDDDYYNYTSPNITDYGPTSGGKCIFTDPKSVTLSPVTTVLAVVNIMTCVLGLAGNSLVIWICGWKMKKTKMNKKVIMTWYISLAVSNLLFCAFLPIIVYYRLTNHWPFGLLLCKLTFFIVDRFVMVMFPVWSRNHRSPWKASVMVAAMWTLSVTVRTSTERSKLQSRTKLFGLTLTTANSIISTVLYVFLDNEFRATLKRLLASRTEAELADLPKSKSAENT